MSADAYELQALLARAGVAEAARQAAAARGDRMATDALTCELAQLWSRYTDLAQAAGLEAVRARPA